MQPPTSGIPIPASVFAHLRAAFAGTTSHERVVATLREAGFAAGESVSERLRMDGAVLGQGSREFWVRLSDFFAEAGWGRFEHSTPHAGVGMLSSEDWGEVAAGDPRPDASCAFTTGLLSRILSEAAAAPVAVLEIECRSRGDARCAFAFGSAATLERLYGHLVEADALDQALARL